MDNLTTQIGSVLELCGTVLDFMLANPYLSIPIVIGIVGMIVGLTWRLFKRH